MSVSSREPRRWLSTEGDDLLEALRPALSSQRTVGPDPSARERIWRELGPRLPPAAEPAQNAASARPTGERPLPPARPVSVIRGSWLQGAVGLGLITGALAFWAAWGGLAPTRPSPRGAEAAKPRCATCEVRSAPLAAATAPTEEALQSARARTDPASLEPMPTESAHVEALRVEPSHVEPARVEPARVEPVHEPSHVEPARVEPVHVEPSHVEPVRADRVSAAPHSARTRSPGSARPRAADTAAQPLDVRSELDLLSRARRVLAADPSRALALTTEHARRHREGVLSQEREVLAIEALVRLGRRELAASRARGFLEEHPESAHRVRLAAVLEEP